MKVLQVFNRYLNTGGEENSVNRIALHLERGGAEVRRFIRSSEEWQGEGAPSKWEQAHLISYNSEVLEDLEKLQNEYKADVWLLHNILPVVSVGVYALAKELNVTLIQWLHNYRPISLSGSLRVGETQLATTDSNIHLKEIIGGAWRGRVPSILLAAAYRKARLSGAFDHVAAWVAVSETMKNHFARSGFYEDRLHYLHHSWDTSDLLPGDANSNQFLYLGRLLAEKGVTFLLELFALPEMECVKLKIAGGGPLQKDVEECGLQNVEFVGWISGEEKKRLIRESAAVLFPSLWEEPLSTIAYEAFEQERPLITSDRGGMVEIVEHQATGLVLRGADQKQWAEELLTLARFPDKAMTMGRNSRRWLKNEVSGEAWFKGFEVIVREASLTSVGNE